MTAVASGQSTASTSAGAAAVEMAGLRFRYDAATPWIVDVASARVERGEQVLLAGPSGSGKSTLLYLIAGLMDPSEGSVKVDGQDVHRLSPHARDRLRGRAIGMIFQTFNLLHGFSAAENVMAALMFSPVAAREHRRRAVELLATLGISTPDREVDRLSVGQQQRVAVARAVACSPVVVLADEPTASLDAENAAGAMELIQETCRRAGAALVCTSHDPAMRARFARTIEVGQK